MIWSIWRRCCTISESQKRSAGENAREIRTCITTVSYTHLQEMENYRDEVIVIFAGYPEKMKEFLEQNEGLASRIAFHLNFCLLYTS